MPLLEVIICAVIVFRTVAVLVLKRLKICLPLCIRALHHQAAAEFVLAITIENEYS